MNDGAKEYGELAFLNRDTIDEVMEELLDVVNWGTFTYLKMFMMKRAYEAIQAQRAAEGADEGFITTKQMFGAGRSGS